MAAILLNSASNSIANIKTNIGTALKRGAVLCALAVSFCAVHTHADEAADKAKLEAVRKNIAALKAELEKTKSAREELLKSLEDTEKNIGDLSNKAQQIKKQINQGEQKLDALKDERSELQLKKK